MKSSITLAELMKLNDAELLARTNVAVKTERNATADVIKYFQEVNRRKAYLALGLSSLFDFLVSHHGYCEPSAQIRINAVKLLNDVPEVEAILEAGEMSLSVAANIQTFLNQEKRNERTYSQDAKIELVEACATKSVNQAKKEFARRSPEIEKRDSVRFTSEDRVRVSHSSSAALEENLRKIKMIWSHVDPNMTREDLLTRMSEMVLEHIDPVRRAARARKRKEKRIQTSGAEPKEINDAAVLHSDEVKRTRYISAEANHELFENYDSDGCEFVSVETGERCGSHFQLQRDHFNKAYSDGGTHEPENLRIVCAQHNRWRWRSRSGSRVEAGRISYRLDLVSIHLRSDWERR